MTEKTETKIEREYVIPLRNKCRVVPRYKKTPKAVKTVKEFLAKHMKVKNRDTKYVRLDPYLNEALWFRGIKKPVHKVKVKVVKEGDIVRVYAVDLPKKISFKKIREEKKSKEALKVAEEKKKAKQTSEEKNTEENKVEAQEKKEVKEVKEKEEKKEAPKKKKESPKKETKKKESTKK